MKLILDVSNNAPIDAALLAESKAVGLIAKATEGTTFYDETFTAHRQVAARTRKVFGSYLFLHPDSQGDEADFYLEKAQPRKGDIQPVIDAEVTNLGLKELADRADSCAKVLEAKGYRPILYASASVWLNLILWRPDLCRLHVWEAQYPGRFTRWFPWLAKLRIRLWHGVTVVMWQWTDSFQVGDRRFDGSRVLTRMKRLRIP